MNRRDELVAKQQEILSRGELSVSEVLELNEVNRILRTKYNYNPYYAQKYKVRKGVPEKRPHGIAVGDQRGTADSRPVETYRDYNPKEFEKTQRLKDELAKAQEKEAQLEKARQEAADKRIYEGKATAGDILGGGSVELTKENIAILRERVKTNKYNKNLILKQSKKDAKLEAKNKAIIEEQKAAGLDNAQIIEWNVYGKKPEEKTSPFINPKTGTKYSELKENKPSVSEKFNMLIENSQNSKSVGAKMLGSYVDVAVYGTKAIVVDVPVATYQLITDPIDTVVSTYNFVTNPKEVAAFGEATKETIQNRPGKFIGIVAGNLVAPEVHVKALKGLVTVAEEGTLAAKGIARSKKGAAFRGSRSSKAGQRVSPMSNVQKSKQARNQFYNAKLSQQPGKIIQKTGRANADRIVFEKIGDSSYKLSGTKKTPRTDGLRMKTTDSVTVKTGMDRSVSVSNPTREIVLYAKGSAKTARQGLGRRPSSQVSTPKMDLATTPLKGNQYVVMAKQQAIKSMTRLDAKRFRREARNAQEPSFNNPSNVQKVITDKTPSSQKSFFSKEQLQKRVANPRDRIVKQTKARLKKVVQKRLAERRGQYTDAYVPESFFDNLQTSRALVPVEKTVKSIAKAETKGSTKIAQRSAGEMGIRINPRNLAGTADVVVAKKRYVPEVEIFVPKQAPRAESVAKVQPKSIPKSKVGAGVRALIKTGRVQQNKQSLNFSQQLGQATSTKSKQLPRNRVEQQQRQSLQQKPIIINAQVQKPIITSIEFTDRPPQRQPRRVITPDVPSKIIPKPFDPVIPVRPKPPRRPTPSKPKEPPKPRTLPRWFALPKTKQRYEVFDILTRKGGKVIKVNSQPVSRSKAVKQGSALIDNTARASFKLKSAGFRYGTSDSASGRLPSNFKQGKAGWLVELSKTRIDSRGEKQEIKKKSPWFSAANIKKKIKGSFWK